MLHLLERHQAGLLLNLFLDAGLGALLTALGCSHLLLRHLTALQFTKSQVRRNLGIHAVGVLLQNLHGQVLQAFVDLYEVHFLALFCSGLAKARKSFFEQRVVRPQAANR